MSSGRTAFPSLVTPMLSLCCTSSHLCSGTLCCFAGPQQRLIQHRTFSDLCKAGTELLLVRMKTLGFLFPHEEPLTIVTIRNTSVLHHTSLNFPSGKGGMRTNLTDLQRTEASKIIILGISSPATYLTRAQAPLAIQLQERSSAKCTSHKELDSAVRLQPVQKQSWTPASMQEHASNCIFSLAEVSTHPTSPSSSRSVLFKH